MYRDDEDERVRNEAHDGPERVQLGADTGRDTTTACLVIN